MIPYKNLQFIKSKIMDAGQALIYRYTDETHKQPIGLKAAHVDENGELYFSLQTSFERNYSDGVFPVELFFYKKGKPFYVVIKGRAVRWTNNSDENEYYKNRDLGMVRVKVDEARYSELPGGVNIWERWLKTFKHFISVL